VYPPFVARQRVGKNVTAVTNTNATIEELLDPWFYVRSMSYQRKERDDLFPELLVSFTLYLIVLTLYLTPAAVELECTNKEIN
jgi:hypothetical protein